MGVQASHSEFECCQASRRECCQGDAPREELLVKHLVVASSEFADLNDTFAVAFVGEDLAEKTQVREARGADASLFGGRVNRTEAERNKEEKLGKPEDVPIDEGPGRQSPLVEECGQVDHGKQFSLTFRFFNYNMANQADLSLEDAGSGFVTLRKRPQTPTEAPKPALKFWHGQESFGKIGMGQTGAVVNQFSDTPVSLFMLMTEGLERSETEVSPTCQTRVSEPGAQQSLSPRVRRSCENDELTNSEASRRTASSDSRSLPEGLATGSTNALTLLQRGGTFKFGANARKMTKKLGRSKSVELSLYLFPPSHVREAAETTVDCVLGTLAETKFPLEDYTKSLELLGDAHVHSSSALQCLTALGNLSSMKGRVAQKVSGDLKMFALCRSTLQEVDGGRVFCSFDESSQGMSSGNPMKSFIGQTYVTTTADSALRLVMLGTHFPLAKVSSLMADTTKTFEQTLSEMKCLTADLLRKILCHLNERSLIDTCTMVILQGDLNSRCVAFEGKYVDLLMETLQDPRLQDFICADLPDELHGCWREVAKYADSDELPASYRFAKDKASVAANSSLSMRDVYGDAAEDAPSDYRQVLEKLRSTGALKEWGLYSPNLNPKDDKAKFKPSRLPACTERVLYYAPACLKERCHWEAPRGYEVNYLHSGSDHKPVLLEATLKIGQHEASFHGGRHRTHSMVPDGFQDLFLPQGSLETADGNVSDDSDDSHVDPALDVSSSPSLKAQLVSKLSARLHH